MDQSSKYYTEKFVVYEKSEVSFEIAEAMSFYYGEFGGDCSPDVSLEKIDGTWHVAVEQDEEESDRPVNLKIHFELEVKDFKILELFSARATAYIDMFTGSYRKDWCAPKHGSSDVLKINENSITLEIDKKYEDDIEKPRGRSSGYEEQILMVEGKMEILYKRKVKNADLKKMKFDQHWDDIASPDPVKKKQKLEEDFTFIVQGQEIKVNKAQIAAVNDKMKLIFQNGTETAEIHSINAESFKLLLFYLIGDKTSFKQSFTSIHSFDLFQAAREYQAEPLMDFCMARIFENFTGINNVVATYEFACQHDIEDLKIFCWEIIQFDIMKFFQPIDPLPVEKVKKYFSLNQMISECCHDVFSTVRLDDDRKRAVLEKYAGQKM